MVFRQYYSYNVATEPVIYQIKEQIGQLVDMAHTDRDEIVEYVEAQPIEGSGAPAPVELPSSPHVYTYYQRSDSCVPCCGPIGCSLLLIALFAMMGSSDLLRGALYAAGIVVLVSLISPLFIRRR